MDVDDQHGDTGQDEQVADGDSDSRYLAIAFEPHFSHRHHGVGERRHKQTDRELAGAVAEERLHDPRRELPHRQLHDDHRDGEDEGRQRHHRHGDRRQDAHGGIRPPSQPSRDEVEIQGAIDSEGRHRDDEAAQHAQHRNEPQARADAGRTSQVCHDAFHTQDNDNAGPSTTSRPPHTSASTIGRVSSYTPNDWSNSLLVAAGSRSRDDRYQPKCVLPAVRYRSEHLLDRGLSEAEAGYRAAVATTKTKRTTKSTRKTPTAKKSSRSKTTTRDALQVLKADHHEVETLFKKFEGLGENAHKSRQAVVAKVIEALSVHAVIEEQILYPEARERLPKAEPDVLEALEEHHVVKWTLSELEDLPPEDERFAPKLTVLMESVRHHVREEENELFPKLREAFSRADLRDIGARLVAAKAGAPTRPHPRSPDTPPGNTLATAMIAPLDAAADLSGAAARKARQLMT